MKRTPKSNHQNRIKRGKKLHIGKEWCGSCQKYLKVEMFGIVSGKIRWQCKKCHSKGESQRYAEFPDKKKKRINKASYKKTAARYVAMGTTYGKETYKKYREISLANAKKWYKKHKDHRRVYMRDYYRARPEMAAVVRHRRRALLKAGGTYTEKQWGELVNHYSPHGKCLACGKRRKLTVDHVIPLSKMGKNVIGNIQCLCYSCNCSKKDKTIEYRPDGGKFARSIK